MKKNSPAFLNEPILPGHKFMTTDCERKGHKNQFMVMCTDRFCPACRRKDGARLMRRWMPVVMAWKECRQIILTDKNKATISKAYLKKLWGNYKKMTKLFSAKIRAAVPVLHWDLNEKTREYHWHINILYDGDFIPQAALSREWEKLTGASIVDVRDKRGTRARKHAIRYAFHHYLKPSETVPANMREETNRVLKGAKLVRAHGLTVEEKAVREPEKPVVKYCQTCYEQDGVLCDSFVGWPIKRKRHKQGEGRSDVLIGPMEAQGFEEVKESRDKKLARQHAVAIKELETLQTSAGPDLSRNRAALGPFGTKKEKESDGASRDAS
jgi:hypothetical protein